MKKFRYLLFLPLLGMLILLFFQPRLPLYFSKTKHDNRPVVTVEYWGQLGNRLFQTAHAVSYALENDCRLILPKRYKKDKNLQEFAKYLPFTKRPKVPFHVYEQKDLFHYKKVPFQKNICLKGYFESEKYFYPHKEVIKKIFSPTWKRKLSLWFKYREVLSHPKSVALHIRTYYYDFLSQGKNLEYYQNFPPPDMKFIQEAISLFDEDCLFVVFSDYMPWCKSNLSKMNRNFHFIEDGDVISDFYLMSMCTDMIISNSTFSWWAAYLNPNPNKKVVVRVPWFGSRKKTEEIVLNNWIQIEGDNSPPLPDFCR